MNIGSRMKECRIILGYSAEQVAASLDLSPATIYRYENGDISKMPSNILKPLADFLCTTPSYLMGWSDEGRPAPQLSSDEQFIVDTYRTLSEPGKQYIHQQLTIASHMFGEKHEDVDQANPG